MRRPSIKTSLIGIFTAITLLFAGLSYSSYQNSEALNNSTQELSDHWLASVSAVDDVLSIFRERQVLLANHILARTPEETMKAADEYKSADERIDVPLDLYRTLMSTPMEVSAMASLDQYHAEYDKIATRLMALSAANKDDEAKVVFYSEIVPQTHKMLAIIEDLANFNDHGATAAAKNADAVYKSASLITGIVFGGAALIMLMSIFFVIRSVANPIVTITGSMRKLAEGDVASEIPFAGRADELGSMATAVEIFRQGAISNRQMEADAETNRKQADADRTADQARAEDAANERLRVATSSLAVGLKRLASGDLAFQLDEALAPEFEDLRHDFNSSVKQLGDTLSAIAETIMSIDNGTQEIAAGSNDLSKRTEQQAASLEETAAALDEITANVANSTKRTGEARTAATDANLSAAKSADVVSHAVDAMGRIESASQQISNIIGVIDEIAFQTNLLALNAGVEAARAGDAGRGFAVVAQEVRELAQRSAKAAKEIKGLILNSTTEVEGGVKLVRDTGVALKTIGEQIADINMHMESIATSAKEQATGLAEINTAVNSMDQGTQQNAAMVEQSTAASASLAIEAAKLRELVAQFKLHGAASKQVATLRQTSQAMAASARNAAPVRQLPQARKVAAGASRGLAVVGKDSWEEF